MMEKNMRWRAGTLMAGGAIALVLAAPAVRAEDKPSVPAPEPVTEAAQPLFATVNGVEITQREFHGAYANFLRQKFYHGQVPEQKLLEAREEVSTQLVEAILFREEIKRRGIEPDNEEVEKKLVAYDTRYATSPAWQQNRETTLPALREKLREQSQFARLEQAVKNLPELSDEEVKRFYEERPDLFTEPEKLRLHTILLQVDPSSTGTAWEAARNEAAAIVKRLRAGMDFEEAARMHSNDRSAAHGGDMGYLHRGMLPEVLHERLDKMALGDISDPIDVLEGVAIFRLDDRKPSRLRDFADVATRARELLQRERQEKAWTDFREGLRGRAKIVMHEPPRIQPQAVSGK